MAEHTSYLANLRFDPKLKNGVIASYLGNPRLVILLVIALLLVGIYSYISLPRTLNPELNIPIVTVVTTLPGANPSDVESLVSIPLEDAIGDVSDVKQINSTSQNSVSVISIEFESGTDPEKARSDTQTAVDSVNDLPEDALDPRVTKLDFENAPVWTFALSGNIDKGSLLRFSDNLKNNLENLSQIGQVSVNGLEEREIQVLIKPEVISTYKLNPQQLSQAINGASASFPSGTVQTSNLTFPLSINPTIKNPSDIRNMTLSLNGSTVPLSTIATISEKSKPNQLLSYYASPEQEAANTITFNVYKSGSVNFEQAVSAAEKVVEENLEPYHGSLSVATVTNTRESIDEQFNDLIRDFLITVVLVFIVLFIFLGFRQALVTAAVMPITFLITFTVMNMTGISLSFIAIFSLLLSLGLLVDDAIVVISAMTAYYRTGRFSPYETGLLVWRDFFVPILTTTITTVWAFLPLLLASGIIGEFIKPIPIVVSSTLLASLFVAMMVTLPLTIILLGTKLPRRVVILLQILFVILLIGGFFTIIPKGPLILLQVLLFAGWLFITFLIRKTLQNQVSSSYAYVKDRNRIVRNAREYINDGVIHFGRISSVYHRIISRVLASPTARRNTIIMVVIFSLFSYLLLPLGFVKNEFFPKSDQEFMYISLELPAGANADVATDESKSILEYLRKLEGVEYVIADIGQSFSATGGPGGGGTNNILFNVRLLPDSKRSVSSIDIGEEVRTHYKNYPKGIVTVTESTGGPPAGADLQIQLLGDNLTTLNEYADKLMTFLEGTEGAADVSKSIKPGTSQLNFVPNRQALAQNQLSEMQLGFWLRTYASGFTLDSIKFESDGNEKKDVTFRFFDTLTTPETITQIAIPTQNGGVLPLSALGKLELRPNPTLITREGGKRTISVSATVRPGYTITTLNQELETFADSMDLPTGYEWKTGGVNEENQQSVNSILSAMILSFILIIVTMVIQFNSFRKAIIVMLVIPLSISGVFIIFALTKTPLSFPALIGVLALFGIVVKNSILVVDKISANEKAGMGFIDSITDAAESRLEPIALTSFTAIVGLIPITVTDPIWRGLGGAIIAGLTFSGTIMLFFIPVVYYYWFRDSNKN